MQPERDWEVDVAALDALVDPSVAAVIVNNPSNPCGSVYSPKHLQQILNVAQKNKVPIIADEIYDNFVST